MHANALIDTGAILALIDQTDRRHRICVETFPSLRLPLIASEAALDRDVPPGRGRSPRDEAAWRFVRSGALELAAVSDGELSAVHALMSRYGDRPMDFADAALVYLASTMPFAPSR